MPYFENFIQYVTLFHGFFHLIGNPGSSDHSVSVSVFTCLYLILYASSTETKQELVVDFHGKDWHVEMLWRKDATFNETFVVLEQVKIFGHDLRPSQWNLARFIDEGIERRHIKIFDIGVFICLGMQLKGLGSTAEKSISRLQGGGYFLVFYKRLHFFC